jgi:hypothetical protein
MHVLPFDIGGRCLMRFHAIMMYKAKHMYICQCIPTTNKSASHSHANTASQLVYHANKASHSVFHVNKASHSVFHVNKARLTAAMPTKQGQGQQSRANKAGQPTSHRASS